MVSTMSPLHGLHGKPDGGRGDPPLVAKLHKHAVVLYVRLSKCLDSSQDAVLRQRELHTVHALVDSLTANRALWKFNCGGGDFILAAGVTSDDFQEQDAGLGCRALESVAATLLADVDGKHDLRMALHAGPVSTGIVGIRSLQFGYGSQPEVVAHTCKTTATPRCSIYGPAVDIVDTVCSLCQPGCLLVTNAAWPHLANRASVQAMPADSPRVGIKLYSQQLQTVTPSLNHARNWDLRYTSSILESSYASFFHRRSVSLDVTFLCIVILSQLSWIHKWEFHGSFLFPAMIGLVSFNLACLLLIFSSRHVYLRWRCGRCGSRWIFATFHFVSCRECIVASSHLVHKVVQVLVTVAPIHGTVYSPNFTPTVALLESSGFAAILMLSFGLRLCFSTQVIVGAVVLLLCTICNPPVCRAVFPNVSWCIGGITIAQLVACYVLPCAMVYALERRTRHAFEVSFARK